MHNCPRLCLIGLLLLTSLTTTAAPSAAAPPEKRVLCWYMVCFFASVEVYKQEIELAQRHGIDGFVLDVGTWKRGKEGELEPTNYVKATEQIYQAAAELGTGFVLTMAPEYSVQPFAPNVVDMVTQFKDHPNQLRHDGKVVLSGYCPPGMFAPAMEKFAAQDIAVSLIPHIFLPKFVYDPSFDVYAGQLAAHPYLDGLMMFNAEALGVILDVNSAARRATQSQGKLLAAGVIPAYNSANLQDYRGLSGYLDMWRGAIDDGADWISLVIWNDYNEDSALMPMRWPPGAERNLYDRDESFLDATSYASAWFKSGRQPTITQDKLFVTYRNRSKWERQAWDGNQWIDLSFGGGHYDQIHDDVEDLVYIDTMLTAPATVEVRLGKNGHRFDLPAGIGHAELPMAPGVPAVTLERDQQVLADIVGRKLIIDTPTKANSLYSYHGLNRTWMSGTAVGPVVRRLEAEAGSLSGDAKVVAIGETEAVQNTETEGSGFTIPVTGLATATYNVRLIYSNPGPDEARLTLFSDGPPRLPHEFAYFIPAYLPPTGQGRFATVSFFWSLYDNTSHLAVNWQPGKMFGQPRPEDDDHGVVLVDAIELIEVTPVVPPLTDPSPLPEMVLIPGGTFSMGSTDGEPDERPCHQVTVADFAMAVHEVTNVEFERFAPDHRALRDGNSWRDRDPVIHVSWVDAAKYCNWLSEQLALAPVYSEGAKGWETNLQGTGVRLPTEAEWEYAATAGGRRRYPWGDAEPQPGVHGRFQLRAALGSHWPRPATVESGTVVVGSYPAGASRDGVMDLAGNVAEWCSDWYGWYSAEPQTDPCQQTPGNFRVIRGGSWSWYSYSQRATDREFNSQNYPGHAYYGLRLVMPAASWQTFRAAK